MQKNGAHIIAQTSLCVRIAAKLGMRRQHVYTHKLETQRGDSPHGYTDGGQTASNQFREGLLLHMVMHRRYAKLL